MEKRKEIIQLSSNPGDCVILGTTLGQGGFGTINRAKWKGQDIAVKRERHNNGGQSVKIEASVLKQLQGFFLYMLNYFN